MSIYRRAIENAKGVPYNLNMLVGKYEFIGSNIEQLVGIPADEINQGV